MSAKFKIGDRVKVVHKCTESSKIHNGRIGKITQVNHQPRPNSKYTKDTGDYWYKVDNVVDCWETDLKPLIDVKPVLEDNQNCTYTNLYTDYSNVYWGYWMDESETLINKETKPKLMTQVTNAFKRFLSPALQKQIKAGLRDSDLELTPKGRNELLEMIAADKADELTQRADEIIAEEKENN